MSTQSGPYQVSVCGYEWQFEYDFAYAIALETPDAVFRIYGPGVFLEVSAVKFNAHAHMLPADVIGKIREQFDLPNSYCLEHARLWSRGEQCGHCAYLIGPLAGKP